MQVGYHYQIIKKVLNDWMDRPTNMLNLRIENILWREGLISYPGFRNGNGYSTERCLLHLPGGEIPGGVQCLKKSGAPTKKNLKISLSLIIKSHTLNYPTC